MVKVSGVRSTRWHPDGSAPCKLGHIKRSTSQIQGKSRVLDLKRQRGQLLQARPLSRVSRGSGHCFTLASNSKSPTHKFTLIYTWSVFKITKFKLFSVHLMENFYTMLKKLGTKTYCFLISFFIYIYILKLVLMSVPFCCFYYTDWNYRIFGSIFKDIGFMTAWLYCGIIL